MVLVSYNSSPSSNQMSIEDTKAGTFLKNANCPDNNDLQGRATTTDNNELQNTKKVPLNSCNGIQV